MTTIEIVNTSGHPLTPARPGDAGCDLRARGALANGKR